MKGFELLLQWRMKSWIKASVWMAVLLATATVQTFSSSANSLLAPLAADSLCKGIDCGNGTCVTTSEYPFVKCDCNAGWKQPTAPIIIPYLACVIPNCSLDYNCNNSVIGAAAPSPSSVGHHHIGDLLTPCLYDVCGGGKCIGKSNYTYLCQCNSGYGNLMNWTMGYCVKECSIQGDCSRLGVTVSSNVSNVQTTTGSTSDGGGGLKFNQDKRVWMAWSMLAVLFMMWID